MTERRCIECGAACDGHRFVTRSIQDHLFPVCSGSCADAWIARERAADSLRLDLAAIKTDFERTLQDLTLEPRRRSPRGRKTKKRRRRR